MNPKTVQAIVLGTVIPSIVLVVALVVFLNWRRSRSRAYRYDQITHDFDEEEIEFKRMLESQHGSEGETDDSLFGESGEEDLEFSAADRDRLSMLDKLRNNLMAESDQHQEAKRNTIDYVEDGDEERKRGGCV